MMSIPYKASLGITAIITTVSIITFFAFIVAIALFAQPDERAGALIIGILFTLICIGFYVHRTSGYTLDDENLIVHRLIGDIRIPVEHIRQATLIRRETMDSMKIEGSIGGFFGYFGEWKTPFGLTRWFATRLDHLLLIETTDTKSFIITPDDTKMVRDLRERIMLLSLADR